MGFVPAVPAIGRRRTWPSRVPLVVLALVASTLGIVESVPFLATVPLVVCLLLALAGTRRGGTESRLVVPLAVAAAVVGTVTGQLVMVLGFSDRPALAAVLGGLAALTAVAAVVVPRLFWLHLTAAGALHVLYVWDVHPDIDVGYFVRDSTAALLDGRNPWALTFHNPYTAAETARLWAEEFVDGDRILLGYPYLPGSLVAYLPGHVVGEVRLASVAALLVATALVWRMTTDLVGRILVTTLPLTALALLTSVNYWIEPALVLGVALLAWSARRGSRVGGAAAVALLLSTKQYAVVWLPLERLVRRTIGVRALLAGVGAAALLVVAGFLWAPAEFWQAVVRAQLVQPYRADSISLAVDLVDVGVPIPAVVLSVSSLLAGLAIAAWVRATAPAGATWLVLGIGLSLLGTVLLSKQAFTNYYFLIHACAVFGAALWPADLARDEPDARSD
ncbi:hypothetical protein [Nocardioides sp.]|uniref:hypothetical protein n=1 Tax=Nocardioides sp. TaxID=35761 RepID=UPI0035B2AA73